MSHLSRLLLDDLLWLRKKQTREMLYILKENVQGKKVENLHLKCGCGSARQRRKFNI